MQEIKKVVIIGPESTGKSMLCSLLAKHYNAVWCAEYAREYLLKNGTAYTFEDLLVIAKGQLDLEDEMSEVVNSELSIVNAIESTTSRKFTDAHSPFTAHHSLLTTHHSPLLFVDTDMYVMKVWCEYVFGKCHQFILDEIVRRKYDLYLLCKPDIPWVKDELREYPDEKIRLELYNIYKDLLINQPMPWVEISGDYDLRLQAAIHIVDKYFLNTY